jgi:hypothetical protein
MKVSGMKAQQVGGPYGDILWDLPNIVQYLAGQDIYATVYVANTTDQARSYMLRMRVLDSTGSVVGEGTLRVNNMAWFDVGSWEYLLLPGSMRVSMTGVTLVVELIDRESNEATDSVSTYLVSPSLAQLPIWGGPVGGWDLTSLIVLMMMMGMVAMMAKEEKKKELPTTASVP